MTCQAYRNQLVSYVEELLDAAAAQDLEVHLRACADCRGEEVATRQLHERLLQAGAQPIRGVVEQRVMDEICSRRADRPAKLSVAAGARPSRRPMTMLLVVAASVAICVGAALFAWMGGPSDRSSVHPAPNQIAGLEPEKIRQARAQLAAALDVLAAADGGDETVFAQGVQTCLSEYDNQVAKARGGTGPQRN